MGVSRHYADNDPMRLDPHEGPRGACRTCSPSRRGLAARSQQRVDAEYGQFVATRLAQSDACEVGPIIATVDPLWRGCTGKAQGLHHLRKRSSGGALVSVANTLRSCNACNGGWIEDSPRLAHAAGLTVIEGDPDWDRLGARAMRQDGSHDGVRTVRGRS